MFSRKIFTSIIFLTMTLAGCSSPKKTTYKDNFPDPCTSSWFVEIEREVKLINPETGRPRAGSPQWLAALDEKYNISGGTSTKIGDIEWCHQVHQQFVGL